MVEQFLTWLGFTATAPTGYEYLTYIFQCCFAVFMLDGFLACIGDIVKSTFRSVR